MHYLVLQTRIHKSKLHAFEKILSKEKSFTGLQLVDDQKPRSQLVTIRIRIKVLRDKYPKILAELANTFGGIIYHTPADKDTWEPAHKPPKQKGPLLEASIEKDDFIHELSTKGIMVFGRDSDTRSILELLAIKNYLVNKGYDARLLKTIKDVETLSNESKARLWGLLMRFSVMLDRYPSGHIAEFQILKQQDTIIALLRPKGIGSTYMIGENPDSSCIKEFVFEESPTEVLDDAIVWAEGIAKRRTEFYNKKYHWRKGE